MSTAKLGELHSIQGKGQIQKFAASSPGFIRQEVWKIGKSHAHAIYSAEMNTHIFGGKTFQTVPS